MLKVSKSQNQFMVSSILPKNEQKIQLYYYDTSGRIIFIRFLGEFRKP